MGPSPPRTRPRCSSRACQAAQGAEPAARRQMAPFCMLMANPAPSHFPSVYFWVWLETKKLKKNKKLKIPFAERFGWQGRAQHPAPPSPHPAPAKREHRRPLRLPAPSISLLLGQDLAPAHQLLPALAAFMAGLIKDSAGPACLASDGGWRELGPESPRS